MNEISIQPASLAVIYAGSGQDRLIQLSDEAVLCAWGTLLCSATCPVPLSKTPMSGGLSHSLSPHSCVPAQGPGTGAVWHPYATASITGQLCATEGQIQVQVPGC